MCIVWPCTDSQLHVNLHTEIQVFIQVMRIFYLFRNARIDILSALVALSVAGWRLFLDGQSIFSGYLDFLSGRLKVRLCWLNCFCTLASRVIFFYFLSLSLSLSFSLSLSPSLASKHCLNGLWHQIEDQLTHVTKMFFHLAFSRGSQMTLS